MLNVKLVLVKPALATQVYSDLRGFEYCIRRRNMCQLVLDDHLWGACEKNMPGV